MLQNQLQKLRDNIGVILTIVTLYAVWQSVRSSFGFKDYNVGQLISQLQAEDVRDITRDSLNSIDQTGIKALTEANTIMLCSIVDAKIKNTLLPCKRLFRERGLE